KKPLVHYVDYPLALSMIEGGDVWLDVRLPDEYANHAFKDSMNIPLLELRDKTSQLLHNRKYIICCDTGRRSASAAFLLSQRGFEVYVLEGGLNKGVPPEVFGIAGDISAAATTESTATAGEIEWPGGNSAPEAPHEKLDAAREETVATKQELAELQDELDGLLTRFARYLKKVERLETVCKEVQHAREDMESELENLKSRFARPLSLD
ncbi:MAG: hypothetical protein JSU75_08550, partial [Gammaproteobacteria bacterium]